MNNKLYTTFIVDVPEFIFPGFYNTDFDPSNVLEDDEGEYNEEDYTKRAEEHCENVINNIIDHYRKVLPNSFRIRNYKLISPKQYNYRNDVLKLEIGCTHEDILSHFFDYDKENLIDYLDLTECDGFYHEALLEVLLEFWPFDDPDEEWDDLTIKEKFIYG